MYSCIVLMAADRTSYLIQVLRRDSDDQWSMTSPEELDMRREMRQAAKDKVDKKIRFLSRLTDAIDDIMADV